MKKWLIGLLLLVVAFVVSIPAGLYTGGWVFIKLADVPDTMLGLHTLQQYNAAYGHVSGIRKLIKIGQFIAGLAMHSMHSWAFPRSAWPLSVLLFSS